MLRSYLNAVHSFETVAFQLILKPTRVNTEELFYEFEERRQAKENSLEDLYLKSFQQEEEIGWNFMRSYVAAE